MLCYMARGDSRRKPVDLKTNRYPGLLTGPNAMKSVLKWGRGRQRTQNQRNGIMKWIQPAVPVLKIVEETTRQDMEATSRSWKR